jgi:hypothetical protein
LGKKVGKARKMFKKGSKKGGIKWGKVGKR